MNNYKMVKKVLRAKKTGISLIESLREYNLTYEKFRVIADKEGIDFVGKIGSGKPATTYTIERARIVKKRLAKGEFLKDVCEDMGMDPRNMARWCRLNDFKMFTKKAMRDNYKRRGENPRSYKEREPSKKKTALIKHIKAGKTDKQAANFANSSIAYATVVRAQLR